MSDTAPRNPTGAPQMLADALLRSAAEPTALLRVTGSNTDTGMSEVGLVATTFAEVPVSPVVDAKAAAHLAGRRRVEVGTAGLGHQRRATGGRARSGFGAGLFSMTLAVTVAGQDYLIESIASNEAFGQVYLYRLLLREARQQGV